jgi:hypothetical protein
MKIIGIIILVILGISLLLLTCMGLYALWFMAFPEFIKNIKDRYEDFQRNKR